MAATMVGLDIGTREWNDCILSLIGAARSSRIASIVFLSHSHGIFDCWLRNLHSLNHELEQESLLYFTLI